jgi:hypothetical protein
MEFHLMPPPVPPAWFPQRQGKMEPVGENAFRLTAPNQGEAFIFIQKGDNGLWSAGLKTTADGPVVAQSEHLWDRPEDAWGAAFEIYRKELVV